MFSQHEYKWNPFLGSCPVGQIRFNRFVNVASGLLIQVLQSGSVACGGNTLSIRGLCALTRQNIFLPREGDRDPRLSTHFPTQLGESLL